LNIRHLSKKNSRLIGDYFSLAAVLRHLVQILRLFPAIFLLWRLMAMVLLVAMLEWERLWAERGPRPQTWQVRDIKNNRFDTN